MTCLRFSGGKASMSSAHCWTISNSLAFSMAVIGCNYRIDKYGLQVANLR